MARVSATTTSVYLQALDASVMDVFVKVRLRERIAANGGDVCFVANPGNAGDALIADATYRFFQEEISEFIPSYEPGDPKSKSHSLMIYGGGGNLSELYEDAIEQIERNVESGGEVFVLPHTISGFGRRLARIAHRLSVVCREKRSLAYLEGEGFPVERLILADDMAITYPPVLSVNGHSDGLSGGVRVCLRTDRESAISFTTSNNVDISRSWEGRYWSRSSLARSVTQSIYDYLYGADLVISDRLHVIIAASNLNINTIMIENSYFKNAAVYEHSLKDRFPNTILMPEGDVRKMLVDLRINVIGD